MSSKPANNAVDAAAAVGAEHLTKDGSLFGTRRFGCVFVYHNGARSYHSGRGFRTALRV